MDARQIYDYVQTVFPGFGLNKRNEVVRLLYEVSRRDGVSVDGILDERMKLVKDFEQVKAHLLSKRYPSLTAEELARLPPLTAVSLLEEDRVRASGSCCAPREVFYEKDVAGSAFLKEFRKRLPEAQFSEIPSYREYVKDHPFSIREYNRRADTFFVVREKYDFFLSCPCSAPSRPCGYDIMNAGIGCGFDCVYCYLQGYVNAPGIVIPGNLDEILGNFPGYYRPGMRLGTGQFTDSLALDHLTGFSSQIIDYFRKFPDATFEFKTKSNNVDLVVGTPPAENIVIAWSLNPSRIVEAVEYRTASLNDRFAAAQRCVAAGYHVAFHFDPIVFYEGWEEDYQGVVDGIFQNIPAERIAWISLGCLRMTVKLRQVMERRFPESGLLDAELILGFDGKLRYPRRVRQGIYQVMIKAIRERDVNVCVYLCMEDDEMNTALDIKPVGQCSR